jgi:hypothetical protein
VEWGAECLADFVGDFCGDGFDSERLHVFFPFVLH